MANTLANPISIMGIAGLESALNAAIPLDPILQAELANLKDKQVALACEQPEFVLTFVLGDHIQLLQSIPCDDPSIDASLYGSANAWFELIRASDKASALINSDLKLRGDSRLFQHLAQLVDAADIDWEGWLAERIGDVPTQMASLTLEKTRAFGKQAANDLDHFIKDFLQSEKSPLTSKEQSSALYGSLRDLEMRIDRLEAQVKRIKN